MAVISDISTTDYTNMVEETAHAMAEIDDNRYWKIDDDELRSIAQRRYEGMAKRHLAAHRVLWNWTHR